MDVSVSHLNKRLSLQLPTELPLGLVFVIGIVGNIKKTVDDPDNGRSQVWFELTDEDYYLRCRLSDRAVKEVTLIDGDEVRAGGHLIYDTAKAHYYLLARDVTVILPETPPETPLAEERPEVMGRKALTPILADIKRRANSAKLAQTELPVWVQRMAPPEVQEEIGKLEEDSLEADPVEVEPPDDSLEEQLETAELSDDLVEFLSVAMEDMTEVEVTPEMIEEKSPGTVTKPTSSLTPLPYEVPDPKPTPAPPTETMP